MPASLPHCADLAESQGSDIATHFATSFSRLHGQFHRSTSSTKAHSLLQILSETTEAEVQLHCVTELGQASVCNVLSWFTLAKENLSSDVSAAFISEWLKAAETSEPLG